LKDVVSADHAASDKPLKRTGGAFEAFSDASKWRRAIDNPASFALVRFAMSVSVPSGRRTRHIDG
jgi:hypothetical protein